MNLKIGKMKKNKYYVITAVIFLLILLLIIFRKSDSEDKYIEAIIGDISQEIFESGVIKKDGEINLGFKLSGIISEINITSGQDIKRGDVLAKLDTRDLILQLEKANNNLSIAQINLQKVVEGASSEEIKILENKLKNASLGFNSTKKLLQDTKNLSAQRKDSAYRNALPGLNNSLTVVSETLDELKKIYNSHFATVSDSETRQALLARDGVEKNLNLIRKSILSIQNENHEAIDLAVFSVRDNLNSVVTNVNKFLNVMENSSYTSHISSAEILIVNSQKNKINAILSSLASIIQSIELSKSTENLEVTSAETQLISAESNLEQIEKELKRAKIALNENEKILKIQLNQAKQEIETINNAINDSTLRAPFDGKILKLNLKENEMISVGQAILSLEPELEYQVEVLIYEGDIGKISIDSLAKIEIVAFPKEIYYGKVVFIEPVATITDGVVFYKIRIAADNFPAVLSGMSADVTIIFNEKKDVVMIPETAINWLDDKSIVEIKTNGNKKTEIKEVIVGMKGGNKMVEIISGINSGDKVILR